MEIEKTFFNDMQNLIESVEITPTGVTTVTPRGIEFRMDDQGVRVSNTTPLKNNIKSLDEFWPTNILEKEYCHHDFRTTIDLYERNVLGMFKQIEIKKVIYNNPATIVFWTDGTKTIVKCSKTDIFDEQTGLLMCIAKKFLGNTKVIEKHVPKKTTLEEQTKLIANSFRNFGKAVSTKDISHNFPNLDKFFKLRKEK